MCSREDFYKGLHILLQQDIAYVYVVKVWL
jgi:hypothetical protein